MKKIESSSRRYKFLSPIIFIFSLIISLAAAEIAARLIFKKNIEAIRTSSSDLYYYYDLKGVRRHIPGKIGYERMWDDSGKAEFKINSLGFRGEEISPKKPAGVIRIFFLGDSITLGGRLPQSETFIERIYQALKSNSKNKIEVINAGVGDVGTEEEKDLLDTQIIRLSPDVVFLCWFLNDGRPPVGFPEEKIYKNPLIQWLNQNGILRKSYLAGWVYNALRQYLLQRNIDAMGLEDRRFQWVAPYNRGEWAKNPSEFADLVQSAQFDWGDAWDENSLKKSFQKIRNIQGELQKRGIKFGLVVLPVHAQLYAQFNSQMVNFPQLQMEKFCQETRIPYLDILSSLQPFMKERLFYDHCHYTPRGNEIIAQTIVKFGKKTWPNFPSTNQ